MMTTQIWRSSMTLNAQGTSIDGAGKSTGQANGPRCIPDLFSTALIPMALVIVAILTASCRDAYWRGGEYTGGPASFICGRLWSHDRRSFVCRRGTLRISELGRLRSLEAIVLENVKLGGSPIPSLSSISAVHLHRVQLPASRLPFLNVKSLLVSQMDIPSNLQTLTRLESLSLLGTPPPSVEEIASLPNLKDLTMANLRCPQPRCEDVLADQLRDAAPALSVRVTPAVSH